MCRKNSQQENFKHCQAKSKMLEGALEDMSEDWEKELKEKLDESNKQLLDHIEALEKQIRDIQNAPSEKI